MNQERLQVNNSLIQCLLGFREFERELDQFGFNNIDQARQKIEHMLRGNVNNIPMRYIIDDATAVIKIIGVEYDRVINNFKPEYGQIIKHSMESCVMFMTNVENADRKA